MEKNQRWTRVKVHRERFYPVELEILTTWADRSMDFIDDRSIVKMKINSLAMVPCELLVGVDC